MKKQRKKSTPADVKKQLDAKDKEISNLKAQLESLTKADTGKAKEDKKDETEGF